MIDNKKVIEGQKEVIMHLLRMSEMCSEDYEPYYDKLRNYSINTWALLENLLKEQEAVKPIVVQYAFPVYFIKKYYCGICKEEITRNNVYCHKCGRKVKWDD